MIDPYEILKSQQDIQLVVKTLPEEIRGVYMGRANKKMIVLNRCLTQTERRCTLTHELAHFFLGHADDYFEVRDYYDECCYGKKEQDAKVWAVDRLIDTHELLAFAKQDHQLTVEEIAEHFWVTKEVLFFKWNRLTNIQASALFFMPDATQ